MIRRRGIEPRRRGAVAVLEWQPCSHGSALSEREDGGRGRGALRHSQPSRHDLCVPSWKERHDFVCGWVTQSFVFFAPPLHLSELLTMS